MLKYLLTSLFVLVTLVSYSQTPTIKGRFQDSATKEGLIAVSVLLENTIDASIKASGVTDENGNFKITLPTSGTYLFKTQYVGYKTYSRRLNIQTDLNMGNIDLKSTPQEIRNIEFNVVEERTTQKGDTTEINANAYKTTKDASAQDLITKMPGMTNENGTIKHQGEEVKKVLVDGKPFFGDDPSTSLKTLPADMVDKVQVYDRVSDQSLFSGFDDGNTTKTINIITKDNSKKGQFGKFYAGYGTDNRYNAGFNMNFFNGNRRFSILGMSNNINEQNFSIEDLLGATGQSMRHGHFGGGGSRSSRGGWGMGSIGNFLVNSQPGNTQTHAFGLNYSNYLGKKIYFTGSYFVNYSNGLSETLLNREFITSNETGVRGSIYRENDTVQTTNMNNRINLRMDYTIDTNNILVLIPSLSFQNNSIRSTLSGGNIFEQLVTSSTNTFQDNEGMAYNFNNTLLFRHRFSKPGRNFTFNLGTNINNNQSNGLLESYTRYYENGSDTLIQIDQSADNVSNGYNISPNFSFVEPLSKKIQLKLTYNPSWNHTYSDKETRNADINHEYNNLDTALTNKYLTDYMSQEGGVSMRYFTSIINIIGSISYKNTLLKGIQNYPVDFTVEHQYHNLLPSLMGNIKFSKTSNLRIFYRTNNNLPSVSQLQDVIDNSNPLNLYKGNKNLDQEFSHNIFARFGKSWPQKGKSFSTYIFGSFRNDYIGNATILSQSDSLVYSNNSAIILRRGSQLTMPINLDGYKSMRTFFSYGMPVKFIKSNLNFNWGLSYSHIPGLINNLVNYSNTYTLSPGITLSSNISDKIDFTLSYYANYNSVKNTLQSNANDNYFYHTASARLDWIFWKGFALHTDASQTIYTGLGSSFNQSYLIWNIALGKKLLKNQNAEIRLSAYDILNQNQNITRDVTETYIEDQRTNILQRYFMINFIYNLRNFADNNQNSRQMPSKP
jgi:hypothetical protein